MQVASDRNSSYLYFASFISATDMHGALESVPWAQGSKPLAKHVVDLALLFI